MKKVLTTVTAMALSFTLTSCAELQSFVKELPSLPTAQSQTSQSKDDFSTALSDTEFSERMIKQIYTSATYNYEEKAYEVLWDGGKVVTSRDNSDTYVIERNVETKLKDFKTDKGELRYFYSLSGNEYRLFVFKKIDNRWELIANETNAGDNPDNHPNSLGGMQNNLGFTELSKNKLAFTVLSQTARSHSEEWVYLANNKLKYIDVCSGSADYFDRTIFSCKETIRKDLPPINGFYPLEFNYTLEKYGKDKNGNMDTDRPPLATKKCKVEVKFNANKQEYQIVKPFKVACKNLKF